MSYVYILFNWLNYLSRVFSIHQFIGIECHETIKYGKQHFAQLPNYMSQRVLLHFWHLSLAEIAYWNQIYIQTGNYRHGWHTTHTCFFTCSLHFFFSFFFFCSMLFCTTCRQLETPKHERHIVIIIIIVCLDEFQANASSKQKVLTRMLTVCSAFWIIY